MTSYEAKENTKKILSGNIINYIPFTLLSVLLVNSYRLESNVLGKEGFILFNISLIINFIWSILSTNYALTTAETNQYQPFGTLFSKAPSLNQFLKILLANILTIFIIMIGFMLFIIPGIILSYSYILVPYLILKDENIEIIDALKESRKLMNGEKFNMFVFQMSFIGWVMLSFLIFPIFYVMPYITIATTFCINAIINKKQF